MKKLFFLTLVFAVTLSACGGGVKATEIKSTVSDNPYSKATQAIAEKWIAAYKNRDTKALLSLYSDDITWDDCSSTDCGTSPLHLSDLRTMLPQSLLDPTFKVEIQSYFVTKFGEKVVLEVLYSDGNVPVTNAPSVIILEIKDSKITRETWYESRPQ